MRGQAAIELKLRPELPCGRQCNDAVRLKSSQKLVNSEGLSIALRAAACLLEFSYEDSSKLAALLQIRMLCNADQQFVQCWSQSSSEGWQDY